MNEPQMKEQESAAVEEAPEVTDEEASDEVEEADDLSTEEKRYRRRIVWKQRIFKWTDEASNSAGYAVWVVAAFVAILFLVPYALNLQSTVVLTGSMSGTIEQGDVVLTKGFSPKYDKLAVGDVALFSHDGGTPSLHRVSAINDDGSYTMLGDANDVADFFKPTNEDIRGVVFNTIHQPQAGFLSLFSLNFDWFRVFWAAVSTGQWSVAGSLLPIGPWGVMILVFAALLFWSIIPRLLQRIVNRANLRAALELERLRRAVVTQEEAITDQDETMAAYEQHFAELDQSVIEHEGIIGEHEEVIAEVTPVVREIVQEREEEKAEKEASAQAIAAAWDKADFTQIYDEPEEESDDSAFFDVYNKQFNTDIPSAFDLESEEVSASDDDFSVFSTPFAPGRSIEAPVIRTAGYFPRFAKDDDLEPINPFSRITRKANNAPSAVTSASLRDEDDQFAALGLRSGRESRSAASAFDLEEI